MNDFQKNQVMIQVVIVNSTLEFSGYFKFSESRK